MNTTSTEAQVIPFNRAERNERLTGGNGDVFRTAAAQDVFRARWNAAQERLAR